MFLISRRSHLYVLDTDHQGPFHLNFSHVLVSDCDCPYFRKSLSLYLSICFKHSLALRNNLSIVQLRVQTCKLFFNDAWKPQCQYLKTSWIFQSLLKIFTQCAHSIQKYSKLNFIYRKVIFTVQLTVFWWYIDSSTI